MTIVCQARFQPALAPEGEMRSQQRRCACGNRETERVCVWGSGGMGVVVGWVNTMVKVRHTSLVLYFGCHGSARACVSQKHGHAAQPDRATAVSDAPMQAVGVTQLSCAWPADGGAPPWCHKIKIQGRPSVQLSSVAAPSISAPHPTLHALFERYAVQHHC